VDASPLVNANVSYFADDLGCDVAVGVSFDGAGDGQLLADVGAGRMLDLDGDLGFNLGGLQFGGFLSLCVLHEN